MLSDRQIKAIKPSDKHQYIADGEGLYLRVHPTGKKQFLHRTTTAGKTVWTPLGDYPQLSLSDARERVRNVVSTDSVNEVYKIFDKRVLAKYKRPDIPRSRFELDVLPSIGAKRVMDVTTQDVSKILDGILDRGSPIAANRTLADLKHFFQFAEARGYRSDDPTVKLFRKHVGGKEKPKNRALSFDEIEALTAMLRSQVTGKRGIHVITAAALYLCLLTGQRASEVLWLMKNATPRTKWITIPIEATKTREHKVYLSIQARAVLRLALGLPIPRDHRVLSHALRRLGATFTPHDLRRTMATRMADLGVAPHVGEKILNHQMEGVMAVYNHAEYLPERRAAWELWGRTIAEKRRAGR